MLDIPMIVSWLRGRADGMYGGEPVTQLEHALQCATHALQDQASKSQVIAALLHDIGHLDTGADDRRQPHEDVAPRLLGTLFGPEVTEPIRLHVAAKRYLCALSPGYWSTLSPQSKMSLEWQGGPFDARQAETFIAQPHAEAAVRLREWDDAAKIPGLLTPPLSFFIPMMEAVSMQRTPQ